MKKIIFALVSFVVVLVLSKNAESQLIIDDFDNGGITSQIDAGVASSSTSDTNILGGQRIESLEVPTLPMGGEFFGAVGFGNGNFVVTQGSLDQIRGGLQYNFLGGTDLTGGGTFRNFALDFTSLDSDDPLTDVLQLSVTSGGTTATHNVTIPDQNSATEILVDLSNFNNVDLTSVDSIELGFDFSNNPGRDFQLGTFSVTSVPEPGSLAVLSIAVSAMLLRRRRNR